METRDMQSIHFAQWKLDRARRRYAKRKDRKRKGDVAFWQSFLNLLESVK